MTEREIRVLEDMLNYWVHERDVTAATDGDERYFYKATARYYVLLDLVIRLGLEYESYNVTKKLMTTEYTTTHYILYAD